MDKTEYKEHVWCCFFWGLFDVLCIVLFIAMITSKDIAGIISFSIIVTILTIIDIALIIETIKEKRKIKKQELEKECQKEIKKEKTVMNYEMVRLEKEIYINLRVRDKICKNKFGRIKNKKLQEDFLNEIVKESLFCGETITIRDVIDEIKSYFFKYVDRYIQILKIYEEKQIILDKYNTLEENNESKTKICNRKKV